MAFFRKIILGVATKQPSRVSLCITQARLSSNLIDASDSDIIQPHIKLKEANEKHLKESEYHHIIHSSFYQSIYFYLNQQLLQFSTQLTDISILFHLLLMSCF